MYKKVGAVASITAALFLIAVGASSGSTTKASAAAACTPKHPGITTVQSGVLTAAGYDVPPYLAYKNGKLGGADGDLIQAVAKMECLKVSFQNLAPSGDIPAVQANRADVAIGDWYRTAARAEVVSLGVPIYTDPMAIISHGNTIHTVNQLKGHQVGSVVGYEWDADLQKLLGSDFHLYQTPAALLEDLKNGRLQATVDGAILFKYTPVKGFGETVPRANPAVGATVRPPESSWPTNKSNTKLRAALDADIQTLRANGTLKKILVANDFPASAANPGKAYYS